MSNAAPSLDPAPKRPFAEIVADRRAALAKLLGQVLGPAKRVVLEVGSGHGHFLTAFAHAHPNIVCVGVDNDSARVARAQRKQTRGKLVNLHFVRADAQLLLAVLPAEIQLSAVYILFPDPWPKLRHHKHRVIQPEFISELERRMAPDSALYFRTDFQPYFNDAEAKFRQKNWRVSATEAWPFERESVFQSRAVRYHSFAARPPGSS